MAALLLGKVILAYTSHCAILARTLALCVRLASRTLRKKHTVELWNDPIPIRTRGQYKKYLSTYTQVNPIASSKDRQSDC